MAPRARTAGRAASSTRTAGRAASSTRAAASTRRRVQWPEAHEALLDAGAAGVDARRARQLVGRGYVLADVRPADKFAKARAAGSVNLQLFRPIEGWAPLQALRRVAFQAQGVAPVEANPAFVAEAEGALATAKGLVLCDAEGGTLRTTTNFKFGKECRSLRALFELLEAGVPAKQVVFLEEGLNSLFIAGYEFEGEEEWSLDYKTPVVATYEGRGEYFTADGKRVKNDGSKSFGRAKSGMGPSEGMNPLDPFGSWSTFNKNPKKEAEKQAALDAKRKGKK